MANGREILSFIRDNRAWYFDATRNKTRRAATEVLSRLPLDVSDFIVNRKRLLLVAPGFGLAGAVRPYVMDHPAPDEREEVRFQIIYLAPVLENSSNRMIAGFLVRCIAIALRPVLFPALSVEDIAEIWGFRRDFVRTAEYWKHALRL